MGKCNWTMSEARAWVKEHEKTVWHILEKDGEAISAQETLMALIDALPSNMTDEEAKKLQREHSQEEIIDEIDYLKSLIDKEGLGDKAKETLKDLMKRLPGNDIPVEDIKPKEETLTNQDIQEAIKRIAKQN